MNTILEDSTEVGPGKCYTLPTLAKKFGISSWQLRRAVKRGQLTPFYIGSKRWLLREADVEALIDATRAGGVK